MTGSLRAITLALLLAIIPFSELFNPVDTFDEASIVAEAVSIDSLDISTVIDSLTYQATSPDGTLSFSIEEIVPIANGSMVFSAMCNSSTCENLSVNGHEFFCGAYFLRQSCWFLVHVNPDGDWESILPLPLTNNKLTPSEDGGFFVTGAINGEISLGSHLHQTFTYNHTNNEDNNTYYVLKFNEFFSLEWTHFLGIHKDEGKVAVSKTGEFAYIAEAWLHTEIPNYNQTLWGDIVVALDNNGEIMFVKSIWDFLTDQSASAPKFRKMKWTESGLMVEIQGVKSNVSLSGNGVIAREASINVGFVSSESGEWEWMISQTIRGCNDMDSHWHPGHWSYSLIEIEIIQQNKFALLLHCDEGNRIQEFEIQGSGVSFGRQQNILSWTNVLDIEFLNSDTFYALGWTYGNDDYNPGFFLGKMSLDGQLFGTQHVTGYYSEVSFSGLHLTPDSIIITGLTDGRNADDWYQSNAYHQLSTGYDSDMDGVIDVIDRCATSYEEYLAVPEQDRIDSDREGCWNNIGDMDDDNDGVLDEIDSCRLSWNSVGTWNSNTVIWYEVSEQNWSAFPDHDGDGCHDNEDDDDDNDGIYDELDNCDLGEIGWVSNDTIDYDGDGCRDFTEDFDDDNDGFNDSADSCSLGDKSWLINNQIRDYDQDGCRSDVEDDDNDGDGILNTNDIFPNDHTEWLDNDMDGIGDNADENDDDDNWDDLNDTCPMEFGTATISGIGCVDTDQDGHSNSTDQCPMNHGTSYIDRLGCLDQDEDGISDLNDKDPYDPNVGVAEYDGPRLDAPDSSSSGSSNLSTNVLFLLGLSLFGVFLIGIIKRLRGESDDDEDDDDYDHDYVNEEYYSGGSSDETQAVSFGTAPEFGTVGEFHESGYEVLEFPPGSENWWWKDEENQCWVPWE